jgi:hypothetical protein
VHVTSANGPDKQFIAVAPSVNTMNTPPLVRSAYVAKAALALRMGRIGENGKRAGEKAFDNGSRKPVLFALGAVALSQSKPLARKLMVTGRWAIVWANVKACGWVKSYPF